MLRANRSRSSLIDSRIGVQIKHMYERVRTKAKSRDAANAQRAMLERNPTDMLKSASVRINDGTHEKQGDGRAAPETSTIATLGPRQG